MDKSGIEQAVEEVAIGHGMFGAETTAEQLDLLRDNETGDLPRNVFPLVRQQAHKGPGRPKGARNKRTQQIAEMVVRLHGDPVLELASMGFMPLDQLVEAQVHASGLGAVEGRLDKMLDDITEQLKDKTLGEEQREALESLSDKLFAATGKIIAKRADFVKTAVTTKRSALEASAPYVHGKQPGHKGESGRPDLILNIEGFTDALKLAEHAQHSEFTEEDFEHVEEAKFTEIEHQPEEDDG